MRHSRPCPALHLTMSNVGIVGKLQETLLGVPSYLYTHILPWPDLPTLHRWGI